MVAVDNDDGAREEVEVDTGAEEGKGVGLDVTR